MVFVHVVLFVLNLFVILFVVPIFGDKYKDFGQGLPGLTWFGLDLSHWLKKFGILILPVWVFLFWTDAKIYEHLYRSFGRAYGLIWFAGVAVGFLLLLVLILLGMWLPVIRMGAVTQG